MTFVSSSTRVQACSPFVIIHQLNISQTHTHKHTHRGGTVTHTASSRWQLCSRRNQQSAGCERRRQAGEKICEEEKLKRLLVKTTRQLDSFSFQSQRRGKKEEEEGYCELDCGVRDVASHVSGRRSRIKHLNVSNVTFSAQQQQSNLNIYIKINSAVFKKIKDFRWTSSHVGACLSEVGHVASVQPVQRKISRPIGSFSNPAALRGFVLRSENMNTNGHRWQI